MALRSDWSQRPCPIARSLQVLGDPWTLLVLRELLYGVRRFEEIRDNLEVSDKTLAVRLQQMLTDGLIERQQYTGTSQPRYEYLPTQAGQDVLPILHGLAQWGEHHSGSRSQGEVLDVICRTCDCRTEGLDVCTHCGAVLVPDSTAWVRPTATDRTPHPLGAPAGRLPNQAPTR